MTATRYLVNILVTSCFWNTPDDSDLYNSVVRRLFRVAIQLVEDAGIASSHRDRDATMDSADQSGYSDFESVDILVVSALAGVQGWMETNIVDDLASECWFEAFLELINLCRK